jgi:hypothetical protein
MRQHTSTFHAVYWKGLKKKYVLEFEDLTVAIMKSSVFWDMTLCSPLKVN